MKIIDAFLSDEEGGVIIEYGMIAVLISIAAVTALTLIGPQVAAAFSSVQSSFPGEGG